MAPLSAEEVARYLGVLGVAHREPSLEALTELTSAHLTRVPFENVSKLRAMRREGLRGVPGLAAFLDGIERHRLGGTCFANNSHLNRLLRALGYDAVLAGADMSRPDVHVVNRVRLGGAEYLVDGGYGAPFLAPLPLDLDHDVEVSLGAERYVLRPKDARGRSRLDVYRRDKLVHGYDAKPEPRSIGEFAHAIAESYDASATFMNSLMLARFAPGSSLVLRNLSLTESQGSESRVTRIAEAALLPGVVEERFGVRQEVTREAIAGLRLPQEA